MAKLSENCLIWDKNDVVVGPPAGTHPVPQFPTPNIDVK